MCQLLNVSYQHTWSLIVMLTSKFSAHQSTLEDMQYFIPSRFCYLKLWWIFLLSVWQFGKERGWMGSGRLGRCWDTFREWCFVWVKLRARNKAGRRSGRRLHPTQKWSWLEHLKEDNRNCMEQQLQRKRQSSERCTIVSERKQETAGFSGMPEQCYYLL